MQKLALGVFLFTRFNIHFSLVCKSTSCNNLKHLLQESTSVSDPVKNKGGARVLRNAAKEKPKPEKSLISRLNFNPLKIELQDASDFDAFSNFSIHSGMLVSSSTQREEEKGIVDIVGLREMGKIRDSLQQSNTHSFTHS